MHVHASMVKNRSIVLYFVQSTVCKTKLKERAKSITENLSRIHRITILYSVLYTAYIRKYPKIVIRRTPY